MEAVARTQLRLGGLVESPVERIAVSPGRGAACSISLANAPPRARLRAVAEASLHSPVRQSLRLSPAPARSGLCVTGTPLACSRRMAVDANMSTKSTRLDSGALPPPPNRRGWLGQQLHRCSTSASRIKGSRFFSWMSQYTSSKPSSISARSASMGEAAETGPIGTPGKQQCRVHQHDRPAAGDLQQTMAEQVGDDLTFVVHRDANPMEPRPWRFDQRAYRCCRRWASRPPPHRPRKTSTAVRELARNPKLAESSTESPGWWKARRATPPVFSEARGSDPSARSSCRVSAPQRRAWKATCRYYRRRALVGLPRETPALLGSLTQVLDLFFVALTAVGIGPPRRRRR